MTWVGAGGCSPDGRFSRCYPDSARFSTIRQKPDEANRAADPDARRPACAQPRGHDAHGGRGARARRGAQRGDPGPQLPGAGDPGRGRFRGRLARPLAQGGGHRRGRDRLLRRPLHGGDRLDPLAGEDRPAARPRRRLLARRLDHGRPAARVEGEASGRDRRDVREHDGRGEGRDRLLLHVGERRAGGRAHLPRARRGHGDPVRPRHVARAPTWSARSGGACTSGTASATCTPASGPPTSPRCATRIPTPSS